MRIVDFLREELILPEIRAVKKPAVIRELAGHLAEGFPGVSREEVFQVLVERERLGSTALSEGIAIPHGKLDAFGKVVACLGRSRRGVDFDAEDGKKTHLLFVLVAPRNSTGDHLKALARISRLLRDESVRARLMAAETAREMYRAIAEQDAAGLR